MSPDDDLLLIDEVAEKLRTSPRTLQRLMRAGLFCPEVRSIDHRHRWRRGDLDAWLQHATPMRMVRRVP